jgi:hypothetical protein
VEGRGAGRAEAVGQRVLRRVSLVRFPQRALARGPLCEGSAPLSHIGPVPMWQRSRSNFETRVPRLDPSISSDGRYVAFSSDASDLVPEDRNGFADIFVRDLLARATVRASVDTGGGDTNNDSYDPSINADGRYVALYSFVSDLVTGDGNGLPRRVQLGISSHGRIRLTGPPAAGDGEGWL